MKVPSDSVVVQAVRLLDGVGELIAELVDGDPPYTWTDEDRDQLRDAYEDLATGLSLLDVGHHLVPLDEAANDEEKT